MTNSPKIAIVQNRLIKGGRLQVIAGMVEVLNEMNIIPDIVTFRSRVDINEVREKYGADIIFKVREIFFDPKIPFEWNILLFNFVSRYYLKKYDLVINSNNTSFLCSGKQQMISYVHYPRKDRNLNPKISVHFPDGPKKSIWDYKTDFLKLGSLLYRLDKKISPRESLIANSQFTKKVIEHNYHLNSDKIKVIYPPVTLDYPTHVKEENKKVVSLARFSPDKRQLDQIKIAERLKNFQFYLIGFKDDPVYFAKCESYVQEKQIKNVSLMPGLSFKQLTEKLDDAEFFIHNLQNEPFGITSVQAIDHGCIPVVHDSGGQKEVVPISELRFNDLDQAIQKFLVLQEMPAIKKSEIRQKLKIQIEKYDKKNFKKAFRVILMEKLNSN